MESEEGKKYTLFTTGGCSVVYLACVAVTGWAYFANPDGYNQCCADFNQMEFKPILCPGQKDFKPVPANGSFMQQWNRQNQNQSDRRLDVWGDLGKKLAESATDAANKIGTNVADTSVEAASTGVEKGAKVVTDGISMGTNTAITAVDKSGEYAEAWLTGSEGTTTDENNQIVKRQMIYPREVTWYFKRYILVMFIINLVLLTTAILNGISYFVKPLEIVAGCFGGLLSGLALITWLVLLIMGTVWRFNHPGKVCAGDFANKMRNEHITNAYNYRLGKCLFGLLITQYLMIACGCCACCGCVAIGKKAS